jgi:hypothetical protein
MVPLKRLTTIVMPHRAAKPTLRSKTPSSPKDRVSASVSVTSEYRQMSAIQILKHGLTSNLWKKEGWLFDLLQNEGMVDGTKQSRKEMCWSYFKSQQIYIEAMQDARNEPDFDPRRSLHQTGKDGRFMKKKNASTKPKNPLTIQYLCFAFAIPYATFKRWKSDAFESKKFVPAHKGKSVLTDKKWASQIFNTRKIYVKHEMDLWLTKHPAKKNDSKGKKVNIAPNGFFGTCPALLNFSFVFCYRHKGML